MLWSENKSLKPFFSGGWRWGGPHVARTPHRSGGDIATGGSGAPHPPARPARALRLLRTNSGPLTILCPGRTRVSARTRPRAILVLYILALQYTVRAVCSRCHSTSHPFCVSFIHRHTVGAAGNPLLMLIGVGSVIYSNTHPGSLAIQYELNA